MKFHHIMKKEFWGLLVSFFLALIVTLELARGPLILNGTIRQKSVQYAVISGGGQDDVSSSVGDVSSSVDELSSYSEPETLEDWDANTPGRYGKPVNGDVMKQIIIYNAVSKCGSGTFTKTAKENFKRRGILMNLFRISGHGREIRQKQTIPKLIKQGERPMYITGHFYLPLFTDVDPAPIYINMIRDPLQRIVSGYSWQTYGDGMRYQGAQRNMSLEACVRIGLEICSNKVPIYPRLCGKDNRCSSDPRWALETAKHNVDHVYTFIGITEEFETSLRIFERLMPNVYDGLVDLYNDQTATNYTQSTATKRKIELSPEMAEMAREQLKEDYEIYNYIYAKFRRMKERYGLK